MKAIFILVLSMSLLIGANSCVVFVDPQHHDNGKHKGWYKNPKNPHNPEHHEENGRNKGHGNENGKGKKKGIKCAD